MKFMLAIPGYKVTEKIHDGVRTIVYRAYQEATQTPVVIKILNTEYPQFRDLILFRNQYAIARNLNHPNIIKCYSVENYRNSYALILEDFGGISLSEYTYHHLLNLKEFFSIAIAITLALESLYQNQIIHKDVKPQNILINPETKQVKLIDFGISSLLPKETAEIKNPNVLSGTLAYISPEQTGRMNRGIDYRTDFYSVGVTFYELLTGKLPFDTINPLELVHCHLAQLPKNPSEVNPAIPQTVSDIVIKLMAKTAESRYQTAKGLRHDLEICQQLLLSLGEITAFQLGQRDVCDRFLIPEKLYGRETEVQTLLSAFDRVSEGSTEMMLVAGFSGIGKTAVVNEVHKPIVRQRGYFIAGKFDQFQRNIPFSALVQAFRNLVGQLLTESTSQLQEWKAKISEALGEEGQVIIDVLPELERIIGKQPLVAELTGNTAQNRFNLLFSKFIRLLATKEHPLVIFLDDLQWADLASLKLIQLLLSEKNTQYLLLIGAYRDNEVFPAHPLMLTLEEIGKVEATVNTITLKPLDQPNLNRLVADTLSCPPDTAMPLTELVVTKTKGNPFFSNQFLKSLHEDGLITFDFSNGYWQCDIAKVRALSLTDDVVEFMALQLQKLPETTQNVLKLAACIGNQFDLNTLAIVNETSQAETAADLWKALQFGLIIPITEVYKFFQDDSSSFMVHGSLPLTMNHEQLTVNYKFLHDRVQQAAYFLIPEDQKQSTHLKIGQLLLKNTDVAEQEEKIFEIVNQLNIGVELITQQTERFGLAQFNLVAGRKAKASTAYPAAFRYLTVGMGLLTVDSWLLQYDLTLALYVEAVEAAFLSGNFEQMEQLSFVVLQQAKTLLDTVKVYEVKIQACITQNKPVEAVQTALGVLKLFGMRFSEKPSKLRILLSLMTTKLTLIGKPIESLSELPKMTLIEKLVATRLLSTASSAAYIGIPELLPLLVFQNVNLFVRYGNNDLSAFAYAWYGLILCGILGDIKSGYNFGELALTLLKMFNAKEIQARVSFTVYAFIKHWRSHVKETLSPLLEAYQSGLNSGDIEYAAWSAHVHCQYSYFIGYELTELDKKMSFYSDAIAQLKQETALNYNNIYRQTVLNLLGKSDNVCLLNGEAYNEEKFQAIHLAANDKTRVFFLYLNKAILCYIFAEYQQAIENINLAEKYLEGATAMSSIPIFYLYDSLAHLATYAQAHNSERKHLLRRIATSQKKLKKWTHYAPMNFLHKFYLVEAERYRIFGSYAEAMDYYDRAIKGAKENGYIQEEAIASELTAQFYLAWGKEKIAQTYLIDAYYCYARWGARAKVEDLEKRYPQLLSLILNQKKFSLNNSDLLPLMTNVTVSSSSTSVSAILDLTTVTKASVAIAQEIQLDKLLPTLMQVVNENVGAEISCLILPQSHDWIVATCYRHAQVIPVTSSQDVPVSLINYVSHTREPKLINDATTETTFAADPYIIQYQPKSILCYPIVYQDKLAGIFYLENNQITGAFTSERLQILSLLSSQIAISLENAKLYHNLQQSEAREREKATQLEQSLQTLQQTQLQLVQNEKMSTLGQLVAGVAHEINNPVGFIAGNLDPAQDYVQDLINLLHLYQEKLPNPGAEIEEEIEAIDLEYLVEDLPKLILSMKEGTDRIRNISTSLRTFSRADTSVMVAFNIHEGIDSTIMILRHRLKANENRPEIQIVKEYGDLPPVSCYPGQINQVFMNILANGIDALEESNQGRSYKEIRATPNQITICTELSAEQQLAIIRIKDNGCGMPESVCRRIFDHSFTTKAVGKGTGLGLSISRQIVVEKHGGQLSCTSIMSEGTEFVIEIPLT